MASSHEIDHRLTTLQFGPRDVTRHSKIPLFFKVHGSVLPKIILPLCMVTIWATANTLIIREIDFEKNRMARKCCMLKTLPDIVQTNWIQSCSPFWVSSLVSRCHSETPPHTRDMMKAAGHGPILAQRSSTLLGSSGSIAGRGREIRAKQTSSQKCK
jgi:hypothetical protein